MRSDLKEVFFLKKLIKAGVKMKKKEVEEKGLKAAIRVSIRDKPSLKRQKKTFAMDCGFNVMFTNADSMLFRPFMNRNAV